ncbi:MAG: lipoate--protein ligase [Candidatus Syntrophosphaera sp.]|nr:lipoate--protein ligase [Candidatus Syntrophosphaera sp.]
MLFIASPSHFAPFNIASEEYILKNFSEDVFLLYRNAPSIIVGRHQNTLAEINCGYVQEHSIPVVRRLTGGGTVFHDLGNLNFSFIMNRGADEEKGFAKYTAPVLAALRELGVEARLEGRNDLTIKGMKFSGNARAVYRDKVQQHGTILFSSRIADLSAALKANPLKFNDKAVKSVSKRVTNVSDHLSHPIGLEEFILLIQAQVLKLYPDAREYAFSPEDEEAIRKLVESKYDTWEWNFGKSPQYNHVQAIRCAAGTIEFHTDVHQGLITGLRIYGDFFGNRDTAELERVLTGLPHRAETLLAVLKQQPLQEFFGEVIAEELLAGLI